MHNNEVRLISPVGAIILLMFALVVGQMGGSTQPLLFLSNQSTKSASSCEGSGNTGDTAVGGGTGDNNPPVLDNESRPVVWLREETLTTKLTD